MTPPFSRSPCRFDADRLTPVAVKTGCAPVDPFRGYISSLKSTKMSGWSVNDHKNYTNPPASGQKRPRSETGNKVTVVLGAQWGDEGKGKVVDLLATESDMVCRCQVLCITLMLVCRLFLFLVCFFFSQIRRVCTWPVGVRIFQTCISLHYHPSKFTRALEEFSAEKVLQVSVFRCFQAYC